jgi:hypothetical protein
MKKFIDFVEDDDEEIDEESEEMEESEEKIEKSLKNNRKVVHQKGKKEGFNEDDFDVKVAYIITNIHNRRKTDDKFSSWVEENLFHLNKLYSLSSLSCPPVEFYSYIYENSRNKQIKI